MSGKYFVIIMLAAAVGMGAILYSTFKHSSDSRTHIADQIKTEFLAYATEVKTVQKLQVAELNQVEVFERTSSLSLFWNQVKLPDVVVSITTPVHFVYTVDMTGPWEFLISGQTLEVHVPDLGYNPPAANLSATKFDIKQGSMFRDGQSVLNKLKSEITPFLDQRAEQNKALVQETARKSIKDFVTTWMNEKFTQDQKKLVVEVKFPHELAPVPESP